MCKDLVYLLKLPRAPGDCLHSMAAGWSAQRSGGRPVPNAAMAACPASAQRSGGRPVQLVPWLTSSKSCGRCYLYVQERKLESLTSIVGPSPCGGSCFGDVCRTLCCKFMLPEGSTHPHQGQVHLWDWPRATLSSSSCLVPFVFSFAVCVCS